MPDAAAKLLLAVKVEALIAEVEADTRSQLEKLDMYGMLLRWHVDCQKKGITPPAHKPCTVYLRSHLTPEQRANHETSTPVCDFLAAAADGCVRCLHDKLVAGTVTDVNVRGPGDGLGALELAMHDGRDQATAFLQALGAVAPYVRVQLGGPGDAAAASPGSVWHGPESHIPTSATPENRGFNSQLCYASKDGCLQCVKCLLELAVVGVNSTSPSGWTPLDWALFGKQTRTAVWLRRSGAVSGAVMSGSDYKLAAILADLDKRGLLL
jgi:hypothetical protein